jgi:peptidyl-prolyl cis-trans isomerase D
MLDFVRNHTKWLWVILFLLIIPSFVFFGIEGYMRQIQREAKVASVDGHDITQAEWDAAQRRQANRITAENPGFDPKLLDSPRMKYAMLEELVRERVLAAAVQRDHLTVSDARLAEELMRDPGIAALRKSDGTLDTERYAQLLAGQGRTPQDFEDAVRADLALRQVLDGVAGTGLSSPAQAELGMGALGERREAQIVRFEPKQFAGQVKVSDAEVRDWYQAHLEQYQAPETVDIQYLVLRDNPEQRRASHILIAVSRTASQEERGKAKARAEQLLAELRKAPDKFAEVAKKESQDPVSAPSGGDLGFFEREGKTLAAPVIAEAAFKLNKGQISDVVQSDFGYHIVRLTDQIKSQQGERKFTELAEDFRKLVYEQDASSLEPAAQELGLQIQTATGVTRIPAPGATGALANPKFLAALFTADVLEKKYNTDAIQIAPNALAAGRVVNHVAAHARAFDEVKDAAAKRLTDERAADLARKDGAGKLAAWQAQPAAAADLPAAVTVSRTETRDQPQALLEAILRADPARLPQFVGVDLGAAGYAVARVNKVLPRPAPSEDAAKQDLARYQQLWSMAEAAAYYDHLKNRFKVHILAPKPDSP